MKQAIKATNIIPIHEEDLLNSDDNQSLEESNIHYFPNTEAEKECFTKISHNVSAKYRKKILELIKVSTPEVLSKLITTGDDPSRNLDTLLEMQKNDEDIRPLVLGDNHILKPAEKTVFLSQLCNNFSLPEDLVKELSMHDISLKESTQIKEGTKRILSTLKKGDGTVYKINKSGIWLDAGGTPSFLRDQINTPQVTELRPF